MSNPLTSHIENIFDIVGKTVDDVLYAPPQHGEGATIGLYFTDGCKVMITVVGDFDGVAIE